MQDLDPEEEGGAGSGVTGGPSAPPPEGSSGPLAREGRKGWKAVRNLDLSRSRALVFSKLGLTGKCGRARASLCLSFSS